MKKLLITFLVVMLGACAHQNRVEEPLRIMLLAQEDGARALPDAHRQMERFIYAVSGQLTQQGVAVYQGEVAGAKTKAQLLAIARNQTTPVVDFVVVLTADSQVSRTAYTTKIGTTVTGQTLSVNSGRVNGAFEVGSPLINRDAQCSRVCIKTATEDTLLTLTGEVTEHILGTLPGAKEKGKSKRKPSAPITQSGPKTVDFTLVFEGFNAQQMEDIEVYLPVFSGYHSMSYVASHRHFAQIQYVAAISRNKLNKNLNRVLSELGLTGVVRLSGNTATIVKGRINNTKDDLHSWEE
ncbi:hypothetical protein [Alteromonas sp. C1M14]|uniref:hypothetical protein n=1 Tax=Alteromonas sp. C1M14 TaxID=2841567 RepID=UPI001C091344|nr:hypothetical protein [Alteromonas sp. C1M14]MBU2978215.1 hypothetical protein [Alteromonas sp. C1M14]